MTGFIVKASLTSFFLGLFGVSWEEVDARIEREYPAVDFIYAEQLLQHYREGPLPVLIDVREAEEFAVSHLGQALNIETGDEVAARFSDRDTPIVVYCSVGYRSAGVAARLEELGYSQVLNLHHSIFAWADRGLPLVNSSGSTTKVHPYNSAWGNLVDQALHEYP